MNNNNNNMDMAKLMNMLAKMDKKELQKNLDKVNQLLNSKEGNNIIEEFKNNNNKQ